MQKSGPDPRSGRRSRSWSQMEEELRQSHLARAKHRNEMLKLQAEREEIERARQAKRAASRGMTGSPALAPATTPPAKPAPSALQGTAGGKGTSTAINPDTGEPLVTSPVSSPRPSTPPAAAPSQRFDESAYRQRIATSYEDIKRRQAEMQKQAAAQAAAKAEQDRQRDMAAYNNPNTNPRRDQRDFNQNPFVFDVDRDRGPRTSARPGGTFASPEDFAEFRAEGVTPSVRFTEVLRQGLPETFERDWADFNAGKMNSEQFDVLARDAVAQGLSNMNLFNLDAIEKAIAQVAKKENKSKFRDIVVDSLFSLRDQLRKSQQERTVTPNAPAAQPSGNGVLAGMVSRALGETPTVAPSQTFGETPYRPSRKF